MFRSRPNGHREVTVARFLASVVFGAALPSMLAVYISMLAFVSGAFETYNETFVSALVSVSLIAAIASLYAIIPVFIAATLGLVFLRYGFGGWAIPPVAGALIGGIIGLVTFEGLVFSPIGGCYGFALWWGLRLFCPQALIESPAQDIER